MIDKLSWSKFADIRVGVIVFDIGGTWFRSGFFTSAGKLEAVNRCAAINYLNTPHTSVKDLQAALVEYLVDTANQICQMFPMENIQMVGISMGAALNAHTKLILDSAPLWGANASPIDLLSMLRQRKHDLRWTMINDVTAALWRYVVEFESSDVLKTCLITISTGIACRIYDAKSNTIPVDRQHGIQGEIGHLPIDFKYENRSVDLSCDCGGLNHLSAFCSGRGIVKLLQLLADRYEQKFRSSILANLTDGNAQQLTFEHFANAINGHDSFAMSILDAITRPIAKTLIDLWTFDPEVERIILTGGVIYTLDTYYLESLIKNLQTIGLYQVSKCDDSFFRRRILIGKHDDESGLIGVAFSAKLQLAYSQVS